jgi:hypothetical protein
MDNIDLNCDKVVLEQASDVTLAVCSRQEAKLSQRIRSDVSLRNSEVSAIRLDRRTAVRVVVQVTVLRQ